MRKYMIGELVRHCFYTKDVYEITEYLGYNAYGVISLKTLQVGQMFENEIIRYTDIEEDGEEIVAVNDEDDDIGILENGTLVRFKGEEKVYRIIRNNLKELQLQKMDGLLEVDYELKNLTNKKDRRNATQDQLELVATKRKALSYIAEHYKELNKKHLEVEVKVDKNRDINDLLDMYNSLSFIYSLTNDVYYQKGMKLTLLAMKKGDYQFTFPFQYNLD